jgi:LPXTG-motif cell wall-anchored protein
MRFKVSTHAAIAAALLFGVGIASAQDAQKSTTTETKKFTVLAVDGNVLDVRLPEGTREINVPDDFRFTVDGKQLSVHELKPGMSGTATITTTTTVTPVTVTEVRNGVVQRVMGSTIVVKTDDGRFQMFTQNDADQRGARVYRDGRPVDLSQLRPNDRLTATIVTSKPPQVMTEQQVNATLDAPAAKAAAAAGKAVSGAASATAAGAEKAAKATAAGAEKAGKATASATEKTARAITGNPSSGSASAGGSTTRRLPKTASPLPLIGLAGMVMLSIGLGLTSRRRRELTQ